MVRGNGFAADSIKRVSSSRLRITGRRIPFFAYRVSSRRQGRFSNPYEEESESYERLIDRVVGELLVAEQVGNVFANVLWAELAQ
jgi:hypothetical protein